MSKKRPYKENLPNGQGYDLEPKSQWEIKSDKDRNLVSKEFDENRRLSGSNLDHFFPDQHALGSPSDRDDYSEDSFP